MTDLLTDPDQSVESPRHLRRWVAAGMVLVVVAVVGVIGIRWITSPNLLIAYPVGGEFGRVPLDRTVYMDAGIYPAVTQDGQSSGPSSVPLTFASILPRINANSANATVTVLVCQRNNGDLAIGIQYGGLSKSCTSVDPFTPPMSINLGSSTAQVIVAVTARKQGTVHIEGFDVTYSHGIRRGSQHAGMRLTYRTK